ncbi:S8 family serine peptidase [Actinomadura sp. 9N407]|uniref:S8 family serine peptidase n=1 Tax=Actinomadura sp. 9N407 TaxID=3375154 RepID=UPI003798AFFE
MRAVVGAVISGAFLVFPQAPAHAAPAPDLAPAPDCQVARGVPGPIGESWADRRLGFARVWPLTRGRGVTTAVIDSGADPSHPMLAGRVARTVDLTGTGPSDCAGHGTGVAALVGGRDLTGSGTRLTGVAPESRLVVIKQQNAERDEGGGARLPKAVRSAVAAGAGVINISIKAGDSPALARAVQDAQSKDVVIVAAAGNAQKEGGDAGPAYPASYPGVISVASLGPDGARAESSGVQSRVDIAAPGKAVPTAWPGGGYNPQAEGTSYAAAYVTGVATLVRSRHPHLNQQQVVNRILTTSDGNAGLGTGRGMVNPVQAVTALVPGETDGGGPAPTIAPAALAPPRHTDERTRVIAFSISGVALAAAALAVLIGVVTPMGRRRRWRPGRAVLTEPGLEEDLLLEAPAPTTIGAPR